MLTYTNKLYFKTGMFAAKNVEKCIFSEIEDH